MSLSIRAATPADGELIVQFIMGLAVYEKLAKGVRVTAADISRDLSAPNPKVFCDIAEWDGEPIGFALWFYNYSTFLGRHGLYLEDLFVLPEARGKGAGKALLKHLARRCVDEGLGRFEWQVLDWNQPSIDFYKSHGAVLIEGWHHCRVDGEALQRLGAA